MELKKSSKADLQNKKGIFFQIGLLLSLLTIIGLFSWSKPEVVINAMENTAEIVEYDEVPQTVQEPPKIEQPKVAAPILSDVIDIVDDKIEVKTDMSAFNTEGDESAEIPMQEIKQEEQVIEEDAPLLRAEKMPTFQGKDVAAFRKWVEESVTYPQEALENGVQGVVSLTMVVGKDGKLSDIKIITSPDKSLGDEVIRVVGKSPKWEPGEQRGMPVAVRVSMPIRFQLR